MNTPTVNENHAATFVAWIVSTIAVGIIFSISPLAALGYVSSAYGALVLGGHALGHAFGRESIGVHEEYGAKAAAAAQKAERTSLRERLEDPADREAFDRVTRALDALEE